MFDFLVLGGGSMATAMAYLLSNGGTRNVMMWLRNEKKAEEINRLKQNLEYLPSLILPNKVIATADLTEALNQSQRLVIAVPSNVVHTLLNQIQGNVDRKQIRILSVVKGLDCGTESRISVLVSRSLNVPLENFAVLSGPNFASELIGNTPSVTIIASINNETLFMFKEALESEHLIVYSSDDVAGVEIASVLKNIIAMVMGIVDGLGFGANTRGAVFTACMKEALDIGTHIFDAKPQTILGPACLGDAITTSFSSKSRNYLLGLLLAKKASSGNPEDSFLCEGRNNVRLIRNLAVRHGIKAPIIEFVYRIMEGVHAYPAFSSLWKDMKSLHFNDNGL